MGNPREAAGAHAVQAELSLQRFHKANLELIGYEYGLEASKTFESQGSGFRVGILNEGTMGTPAILEITPLIGRASVRIAGIVRERMTLEDRPVVIKNLTQGQKITVDGERGLVTEERAGEGAVNKFGDVSLWDFPSLLPGWTWVDVNQPGLLVTVRHTPVQSRPIKWRLEPSLPPR